MVQATLRFITPTGEKPFSVPSIAGGRLERNSAPVEEHVVDIRDARREATPGSIAEHGFELIAFETRVSDFLNDRELDDVLAGEVTRALESMTQAREVVVFDFTRRTDDMRLRNELGLREASTIAHNDYTPESARQRVRDFFPKDADERLSNRFAILNLWKTFRDPVESTPLALSDGRTVAKQDLVRTERRADDRIGEIYQLRFNPDSRWYFYPAMTDREALVFKTYDSSPEGAPFAPHCAFRNPLASRDAPPRCSIEARCFVFY
jgi:hypothetical protein